MKISVIDVHDCSQVTSHSAPQTIWFYQGFHSFGKVFSLSMGQVFYFNAMLQLMKELLISFSLKC